jgi:7-cyano-7-deazaguanine synthase
MTTRPPTAVALFSGGLDSTTLLYLLAAQDSAVPVLPRRPRGDRPSALRGAFGLAPHGYELHAVSVNYGQRHKKELEYARRTATRLGIRSDIIDLSSAITPFLTGSSLTDTSVAVPHGHYAESTMAATVVPNRNAMMLSLAYAIAVAEGADLVAAGMHAGDHFIYPDCRPAFVQAFEAMERLATEGFASPALRLAAPFVQLGKHDIVRIGAQLGVPYQETWSCYEGGEQHCGACGTCFERREAFELAGVSDPTEYEAHPAFAAPGNA